MPRSPLISRSTIWPAALSAGLALALAVGLAAVVLHPPAEDLQALALSLSLSGLLSLAVGGVAARLGWRLRWGGVRLKIVLAIALGVLVALANIAATAALMFLSPHDLALLGLLLGFALIVSIIVGTLVAGSLTTGLQALTHGARRMAGGDLKVRVAVPDGDEVGTLARAFNHMAAEIEAAFARQREIERARTNLIAAVSHDLRTPLASLQAMAEALQDEVVDDPATVRRYLQAMQGDIRRLSALIDDLFELSQVDAGALRLDRQPVALAELVAETAASLQAQADRQSVDLTCVVAGMWAEVEVDPLRVQRVLANLLQNALQHTPPGGQVVVHAYERAREVEVQIADTGEGIPAHALPHIFEPFFRADPARGRMRGGAGLGLSIARGLVEAHGGRIWVESAPGQGATVRFTLPKPPAV
jgi:two-component system sensor histidine kinase BaeS